MCGRGRWSMKSPVDLPGAAPIHQSEHFLGNLGHDDHEQAGKRLNP